MSASKSAAVSSAGTAWSNFADASTQRLAQFEQKLKQPTVAQDALLREAIACGRDSAFGREHGFADISSWATWQRRVPVMRWPDLAPWIERSKTESAAVLTTENPIHFERTSGSTAIAKDIPYTPALMAQFQRALVVWLAKLVQSCPEVAGPAWWSLSPAPSQQLPSASGIPVGSASDAAYLQGSTAECLLASVIDTQACLSSARWKLETLARVAATEDLALISVWSPTFLSALLDSLNDADSKPKLNFLKQLLRPQRYNALLAAVQAGDYSHLWPQLRVISAWADGPSALYMNRIAEQFPQAQIVPKGLFATEGVVSISWGLEPHQPLAIDSHFFEFLDSHGQARLIEELEPGGHYEPVLTTAGGLYRYALGDVVEVSGFLDKTPTVRFVGRSDARSDLVGEKLDESIVAAALAAVEPVRPAVLIPIADASQPHYRLLLQTDSESECATASELDGKLSASYHYDIARRNGQLGPVEIVTVSNLAAVLHSSWESLDKRSGDAKSACLITSLSYAAALHTQTRAAGMLS